MIKAKLLKDLKVKLELANWGEISSNNQEKLIDYLMLLSKWNKVYNLTGIKDLSTSLDLNIMDSLSLLTMLQDNCHSGDSILDIGTGAGLPGIPLAIVRDDLNFILVDSKQKKVNFLQHVLITLGLINVKVVCCKIEDYKAENNFAIICSRAFTYVDKFVAIAGRFCTKQSKLVAMQSEIVNKEYGYEELLPEGFVLTKVYKVVLPLLDHVKRCLIVISRKL